MSNERKREERPSGAAITDLPAEQVKKEQEAGEQETDAVRGGLNFTKITYDSN